MTTASNAPSQGQAATGFARHEWLAAAVIFATLTLAFTWPLPAQMATHLAATNADVDLLMWALGWNAHAFLHQPFALFDANIFHPAQYSLAYSENMIGSALLTAPIVWLTGNMVLAMNVVQISSILLSAIGAYLLARRVGLGATAAIVAGVVFGFAPARYFRMPQAHLTTIQWMPFCLAFLHSYFARSRRPRDLRLAILFYTAQALASGHGAVFLTVAVALYLVWRWMTGDVFDLARLARDVGVPGLLLLTPAALLAAAYRGAQREVPQLDRLFDYDGSTISSYFSSPTPVHQWLLALAPPSIATVRPDAHLFPGVLPIVLALVAVVAVLRWPAGVPDAPTATRDEGRPSRWRHPVVYFAALAIVSVWFTLGPPIGLWEWTYWLPVFSFLRMPSRFVLLEVLALAVLAGFGFQWLVARLPAARQRYAAMLAVALLTFEFAPGVTRTIAYDATPPPADRWLAAQPKPFVVAEVPIPVTSTASPVARRDAVFMLHSTAHWQKIVHGYSGAEPAGYRDLALQLMWFPDDESLATLAQRGVTYVVVHPYMYDAREREERLARIDDYRAALRMVFNSPTGRVYRLIWPAE